MLASLAPREREIVDILYVRGASTVTEVRESLSDSLTASAVRAMLVRLEAKGFVVRSEAERGVIYAPAVPQAQAKQSALGQVVKVFFDGSAVGAASALLGMGGRLEESELDELEALIAKAREQRK